jgi:hypothetical protein
MVTENESPTRTRQRWATFVVLVACTVHVSHAGRTRVGRAHWRDVLANSSLLDGQTAWLIDGVTDGWDVASVLTPGGLLGTVFRNVTDAAFADGGHIVDWYPASIDSPEARPYLTPAGEAMQLLDRHAHDPQLTHAYGQWRLDLAHVESLLPWLQPFPAPFSLDLLQRCMPDARLRDNMMQVRAWVVWMVWERTPPTPPSLEHLQPLCRSSPGGCWCSGTRVAACLRTRTITTPAPSRCVAGVWL